MHVPCVIFDGKSEDFATEMFVIINSTPTRINKSHLVDLYERVSWAAPDKKFAAQRGRAALQRGRQPAPLQDQPPGRPLEAGEVDPAGGALQRGPPLGDDGLAHDREAQPEARGRAPLRGRSRLLQGRREGVGKRVGQLRLHGDAAGDASRRCSACAPTWRTSTTSRSRGASGGGRASSRRGPRSAKSFRVDGFYERFPAKGQVERVARVHRELGRAAGIEPRKRKDWPKSDEG